MPHLISNWHTEEDREGAFCRSMEAMEGAAGAKSNQRSARRVEWCENPVMLSNIFSCACFQTTTCCICIMDHDWMTFSIAAFETDLSSALLV